MAELTATQPMPHRKRPSTATRRRRLRQRLEAASALLLALGGVMSAWCGYEASLLNGQQASAYARAGALRASSTSSSTTAGQLTDIDVSMFLSWAAAHTRGDQQLKDFIEQRFRPEFKPAFEAWLATHPLREPTAPASPFQMAEYRVKQAEDAARLAAQATQLRDEGEQANALGDQFSRITIIFALSLFFGGVAAQFRNLSLRTAVVITAGALMLFGLWSVAQLPRVTPGSLSQMSSGLEP